MKLQEQTKAIIESFIFTTIIFLMSILIIYFVIFFYKEIFFPYLMGIFVFIFLFWGIYDNIKLKYNL